MSKIHNANIFLDRRRKLRVNQTAAESKLWRHLRNNSLGVKFKRQHSISGYITDFYSFQAKLVIEVDGDTHASFEAQEYDQVRTEYFKNFGITVLRFTNDEVLSNVESVLDKILESLP
jgi:very-short-patch-repair endonuclease